MHRTPDSLNVDQAGLTPRRRGVARVAITVVAAVAAGALAVFLAMLAGPYFNPSPADGKPDEPKPMPKLFVGWGKPELAIVLTGQEFGYLGPCGCSHPQKGGLERRYNFIEGLKQRGWPVVALDQGDIPQTQGPMHLPNVQGLLKYGVAMDARKLMGYLATGVGEKERIFGLRDLLDNWELNNSPPRRVDKSITNADDTFPGELFPHTVSAIPGVDFKLGVTGATGPTVQLAVNDKAIVKFGDNRVLIPAAIKDMNAQGASLRALLYQGTKEEALLVAKAFPEFQLILFPSESDEPPQLPISAPAGNNQMLINIGHKGKYVGVVGVFKGAKPNTYDLRYQLVPMGEEYMTPKGKEKDQEIVKLMEKYTLELKNGNYLTKYPQVAHPVQLAVPTAKYAGSEACKKCHPSAYKVWEKHAHAHAYQTLVDLKYPSNREFDGECIVCHVTGFGYRTGFTDQKDPNFARLKDVGCESCHGPGSAHIAKKFDKTIRKEINPWKHMKEPTRAINDMCQKCHDMENDVNWNKAKFAKVWPNVAHPTPADEKEPDPDEGK